METVLVGGDDDAFHGAFGGGGDLAGQSGGLVGACACRDRQHQSQRGYADKIPAEKIR